MKNFNDDHLDHLAQELLLKYELDASVEEVFAIVQYKHPEAVPFLVQAPNRHSNPADHFTVWTSDHEKIVQPGYDVLGYLHTHRAFDGNEKPSPGDLEQLPIAFIGGVYMHGHSHVYWFALKTIFHQSPTTIGQEP